MKYQKKPFIALIAFIAFIAFIEFIEFIAFVGFIAFIAFIEFMALIAFNIKKLFNVKQANKRASWKVCKPPSEQAGKLANLRAVIYTICMFF